jgi:hypothetical protein
MPRITKPGLLGDWFCTSRPGVKADSSSKSWTPRFSRVAPLYAVSAKGTSVALCSRSWAVTMTSSSWAGSAFWADAAPARAQTTPSALAPSRMD